MAKSNGWTRQQLLIAYDLYCRIPFGRFHTSNPEINFFAAKIGRTPSALAMKLSNIASVDPTFIASGRSGLASSSAADKAMWVEMTNDWDTFADEIQKAHGFFETGVKQDEEEGDPNPNDQDYSGEDVITKAKRRVGQRAFRNAVISAYGGQCCISGVAIPQLLVASHIVPWSAETNQRKNPRNGLCLSVLHDKAFDRGLICLDDDLTVQISSQLQHSDNDFLKTALLAYEGKTIQKPGKFWPDSEFLAYHREHIFVG
ncbi:HNH endonuclease [Oceanobacter mangrovi]|uniref:HNH endonuclease n=1 Tax=Oceanobacter mangrovi TaxID=2862510 RepID=UPI001C8E3DDC|nr:HNH endonuclease [Oceanobacter mangrovi]